MKTGNLFHIGVAAIDVTPPLGVRLSGYGSRKEGAKGLDHRLRAEALVCTSGKETWALVTSDIIGYPRDFVLRVRKSAAKKAGLKPDAILISGTHTHSGPGIPGVFGPEKPA